MIVAKFGMGFIMKNNVLFNVITATAIVLAIPNILIAETDSQEVSVSATIAPIIKMSGLNDTVSFGTLDMKAAQTDMDNSNICIYNNVSGAYTVTATSENAFEGIYRLNYATNYLPYTVTWYDNPTAGSGSASGLYSGIASDSLTNADTKDIACTTPGSNASMRIRITQANAAAHAAYTDTLTILISVD